MHQYWRCDVPGCHALFRTIWEFVILGIQVKQAVLLWGSGSCWATGGWQWFSVAYPFGRINVTLDRTVQLLGGAVVDPIALQYYQAIILLEPRKPLLTIDQYLADCRQHVLTRVPSDSQDTATIGL